MSSRLETLGQRLSLNDPWVAGLTVCTIAWWVPQEYIGRYDPLFAANNLGLNWLGAYVIWGAAALVALCTLATWMRTKTVNLFGVGVILAFFAAYYLAWRSRSSFVHNDEDKIVWLLTGVHATLPLAVLFLGLFTTRIVQSRIHGQGT